MTCCFTLVFPVVSDLQSPALNHFLTSKIYLISLPNFQLPLLIYNKRTYISCINQIWLKFFLLQFLHLCRELSICVFLKILFIFFLFSERGEGKEKERMRNSNMWLPLAHPLLGTWPTTQAWSLTGNQTCNPLLQKPTLSPLTYTSHGSISLF